VSRTSSTYWPTSARARREADQFYASLIGRPARHRAAEGESDAEAEAEIYFEDKTPPYDPTFKTLELSPSSTHGGTKMEGKLTLGMLTAIMPKLATAPPEIQHRYLALTNRMFRTFAIDTIESRAFFLAHANVESGEFASMVEGDHRQAYRERKRDSDDPAWTPQHVTPGQAAEFRRWNYHTRPQIAPGGRFLYIGRGPLQVTFSQGYRRAREVMELWGNELGRLGNVTAASTLLQAAGELSQDPTLAAIPDFAFMLSGAHFKSARPGSGGTVRSMDKSASTAAPLRADQFLAASSSMAGVGSFAELKKLNARSRQHVADNINRKMVVFRRAVQAMCAGQTTGVCSNPAVGQPPPRISVTEAIEDALETYGEQPAAVVVPQPYLPAGGRNFVPQQGRFNCAPPTPFVVTPASFLPARTADGDAALTAALTAAGLNATLSGRVHRAGLVPIAREFGARALGELFARLRWAPDRIAAWGSSADSMLVPRLLLHIPGHFRELARRAPDAREAFVLECLGWLVMDRVRRDIAAATSTTWWVPPAPAFVTAVPNPIPPVSDAVRRLITRHLLIDTTMTAGTWNAKLVAWARSLAGRQWQAEVNAPQAGRPFYSTLATIPAHVSTAAVRATFAAAWPLRLRDADAANAPHAAGATVVTLPGMLNAISLRTCDDNSAHLPAGVVGALRLQGLELAYEFPRTKPGITSLRLMSVLHPVFTALFTAIRDLGWNDLLYQTSGGACFRGIKHRAEARVTIAGVATTIDPFHRPDAAKVARINTHFSPDQRRKVVAASRTARSISEHGLGSAIDFNVDENGQGVAARPFGSMDPRLVAIFEAFHFRFGACFGLTDPMHFEYCETPCAPAAATAGTLGPVVTRGMLMPERATGRVVA